MWTLTIAGGCALLSQSFSTWGNVAQIRLNRRRRSTLGLSFFDWESKTWSKLPWLAFILSLQTTDWTLLFSIALALLPPFIVLQQFQKYADANLPAIRQRLLLQYWLLGLTLLLALCVREQTSELRTVLAALPVFCALIAVAGGGWSQFNCNRQIGNADGVAGERCFLLLISNVLWFAYGAAKGTSSGWSEAWTVCSCSGIGVIVYSILSLQILALQSNRSKLAVESPRFVPSSA